MEIIQDPDRSNLPEHLLIRPFNSYSDIIFAAALTASQKWHSETETEITTLFNNKSNGCLIAELNGNPLGICVATAYPEFGFIGELIVKPEYRNLGIGRLLMNHAIEYLNSMNIHNIFLDGVKKAIPLYERLGFRHLCRSLRMFGQVPALADDHVLPISRDDMQEIVSLDTNIFGSDRSFYLNYRLTNYPDLCLKYVKNNNIQAYIFGRYGSGGWITVGPWISLLPPSEGIKLLNSFQNVVGNQPFSLGVLENNTAVIQNLVLEGMMPNPDSSYRMRLGDQFNPDNDSRCFAIGSPAKG